VRAEDSQLMPPISPLVFIRKIMDELASFNSATIRMDKNKARGFGSPHPTLSR
jgi:hypothetical protein